MLPKEHPRWRRAGRRLAYAGALLILAAANIALAQADTRRQIKRWTRLLQSSDVQTRSAAATSLLATRDPSALKALRAALKPGRPDAVRVTVIKAFEFWDNDQATDLIIAVLDDKNEKLRQAAAGALVNIRTPEAVTQLKQAAENRKATIQSRTQVIVILGEMRDLYAVDTLIKLLGDPKEQIAKTARTSLELITQRSFDTIYEWNEWWERARKMTRVQLLEDQNRLQADRLKKMHKLIEGLYLRLITERKDKNDHGLLIEALQQSGSVKVQLYAVQQLTAIKPKTKAGGKHITVALNKALRGESASVRAKAAESLGSRNGPATIQGLIHALEDDVPLVREAAAKSLGNLKAKLAAGPLCKCLADKKPEVSAAAATALGQIGAPKAISPLIALLRSRSDSPESNVYEAAGKALANIKNPKVLHVLTATLIKSKNVNVRYAAVRALAGHNPKQVVKPLSQVVRQDANPQIRSAAVAALAETGDAAAMGSIVTALSDKEKTVRDQAFRALPQLADGKSVRFADAIDRLIAEKKFDLAEKILDTAIEEIKRLPNHSKDIADLRNRVAQGLIAAKAWKKAKPHLEELVSAEPKNSEYLKALISCRKALKEYDALSALLVQALKSAPEQASHWWVETAQLAQIFYDAGKLKAVVDLVNSLEKEDKNLGGSATASKLLELRKKAHETLNPPKPPPAPKPPTPKPATAKPATAKPVAPKAPAPKKAPPATKPKPAAK